MERCSICQKEINRYVGATWLKLGKKDIKICHICNMNLGILQSANEAGTNPDPSVVEYFESINNISLDPELSAYFRPYLDKEERDRLAQEEAERKELEQKHKEAEANMICTTGFQVDGYRIRKYCGLVGGEAVLGTGFVSEFAASVSDTFGKSSGMFEEKMRMVKLEAQMEMRRQAAQTGANAIIGVSYQIATFAANMIGVSVNGTAVFIETLPSDEK